MCNLTNGPKHGKVYKKKVVCPFTKIYFSCIGGKHAQSYTKYFEVVEPSNGFEHIYSTNFVPY